jgi:hypothetical protein
MEFGWGYFFRCYWVSSSKWARFSVSLLSSHVLLGLDVTESLALGYGIYPHDITPETQCSCHKFPVVVVIREGPL